MNESKAASSYTMYQTCNVCTYVESAVEVLSIYMSSDVLFRNLMMDLVIAMTPYVDGKNIKLLYDLALPWLQVYTAMRCVLSDATVRFLDCCDYRQFGR